MSHGRPPSLATPTSSGADATGNDVQLDELPREELLRMLKALHQPHNARSHCTVSEGSPNTNNSASDHPFTRHSPGAAPKQRAAGFATFSASASPTTPPAGTPRCGVVSWDTADLAVDGDSKDDGAGRHADNTRNSLNDQQEHSSARSRGSLQTISGVLSADASTAQTLHRASVSTTLPNTSAAVVTAAASRSASEHAAESAEEPEPDATVSTLATTVASAMAAAASTAAGAGALPLNAGAFLSPFSNILEVESVCSPRSSFLRGAALMANSSNTNSAAAALGGTGHVSGSNQHVQNTALRYSCSSLSSSTYETVDCSVAESTLTVVTSVTQPTLQRHQSQPIGATTRSPRQVGLTFAALRISDERPSPERHTTRPTAPITSPTTHFVGGDPFAYTFSSSTDVQTPLPLCSATDGNRSSSPAFTSDVSLCPTQLETLPPPQDLSLRGAEASSGPHFLSLSSSMNTADALAAKHPQQQSQQHVVEEKEEALPEPRPLSSVAPALPLCASAITMTNTTHSSGSSSTSRSRATMTNSSGLSIDPAAAALVYDASVRSPLGVEENSRRPSLVSPPPTSAAAPTAAALFANAGAPATATLIPFSAAAASPEEMSDAAVTVLPTSALPSAVVIPLPPGTPRSRASPAKPAEIDQDSDAGSTTAAAELHTRPSTSSILQSSRTPAATPQRLRVSLALDPAGFADSPHRPTPPRGDNRTCLIPSEPSATAEPTTTPANAAAATTAVTSYPHSPGLYARAAHGRAKKRTATPSSSTSAAAAAAAVMESNNTLVSVGTAPTNSSGDAVCGSECVVPGVTTAQSAEFNTWTQIVSWDKDAHGQRQTQQQHAGKANQKKRNRAAANTPTKLISATPVTSLTSEARTPTPGGGRRTTSSASSAGVGGGATTSGVRNALDSSSPSFSRHDSLMTPSSRSSSATEKADAMRARQTASLRRVRHARTGDRYINNYRILRTLGRGACGKVKLAFDETEMRLVAIKNARRADTRERIGGMTLAQKQYNAFMREVEVMKKLRHRNIVSLYEVIDDPSADKLYLVMQYVDKGVVAKVEVRANSDFVCDPVPPQQLARYAREMLTGLQYLHRHDVVHRDLKPDNILVSKDGHAYLADFGVAETFDTSYRQRRETLMAQSMAMSLAMSVAGGRSGGPQVLGTKGTPLFIAPELWDGAKSYGKPVDMWAMGVTLFTLLVGKLPFRSPEDITDAHVTPAVPKEFGARWCTLLAGLLNRSPTARWTVENALTYVTENFFGRRNSGSARSGSNERQSGMQNAVATSAASSSHDEMATANHSSTLAPAAANANSRDTTTTRTGSPRNGNQDSRSSDSESSGGRSVGSPFCRTRAPLLRASDDSVAAAGSSTRASPSPTAPRRNSSPWQATTDTNALTSAAAAAANGVAGRSLSYSDAATAAAAAAAVMGRSSVSPRRPEGSSRPHFSASGRGGATSGSSTNKSGFGHTISAYPTLSTAACATPSAGSTHRRAVSSLSAYPTVTAAASGSSSPLADRRDGGGASRPHGLEEVVVSPMAPAHVRGGSDLFPCHPTAPPAAAGSGNMTANRPSPPPPLLQRRAPPPAPQPHRDSSSSNESAECPGLPSFEGSTSDMELATSRNDYVSEMAGTLPHRDSHPHATFNTAQQQHGATPVYRPFAARRISRLLVDAQALVSTDTPTHSDTPRRTSTATTTYFPEAAHATSPWMPLSNTSTAHSFELASITSSQMPSANTMEETAVGSTSAVYSSALSSRLLPPSIPRPYSSRQSERDEGVATPHAAAMAHSATSAHSTSPYLTATYHTRTVSQLSREDRTSPSTRPPAPPFSLLSAASPEGSSCSNSSANVTATATTNTTATTAAARALPYSLNARSITANFMLDARERSACATPVEALTEPSSTLLPHPRSPARLPGIVQPATAIPSPPTCVPLSAAFSAPTALRPLKVSPATTSTRLLVAQSQRNGSGRVNSGRGGRAVSAKVRGDSVSSSDD